MSASPPIQIQHKTLEHFANPFNFDKSEMLVTIDFQTHLYTVENARVHNCPYLEMAHLKRVANRDDTKILTTDRMLHVGEIAEWRWKGSYTWDKGGVDEGYSPLSYLIGEQLSVGLSRLLFRSTYECRG
ncbi:MAG: hypothetical protein AB8B94_09810 [Hyphomicrobiales bacterium]